MRWPLPAVALLALACLLLRAGRVGLAGDYIDPITKIGAQDESLYAHSAIHMAEHGGWLTPMFMGRYGLYKPPLLLWTAGASARLLGISRLALRLPGAILASLAVCLIFLWTAEVRTILAGVCAAALLVSSHLWHVLGGMCMTDGLLAAFWIAAMYCLFSDPWLESKYALWGFSGAVAAAILTKSVAGALPLGVLGLYWLAAPRKQRPLFRRLILAGALSAALAAPWFLYQLVVHHRWFWTEHFGVEILAYGAGQPPQTSRENQALFYLMRMAFLDPMLLAASAIALPAFLGDVRRRSASAVLLLCWMAVVAGAAFGWQYRNVAYLLPILPAAAILAASYGPVTDGRSARWALLLLAGAFVLKTANPAAPWGLSFHEGTVAASDPLLSNYCEGHRAAELILVDADDELYATVLPLPKVRYAFVGAAPPSGEYALDFPYMGIMVSASQFLDLPHWEPIFRQHLREWGLDSPEPIASVVFAPGVDDLVQIIRSRPDTDFFIPERYRAALAPPAAATHDLVPVSNGHFFLLSRPSRLLTMPPARTCRL